jgi:hypothetical protein
MKVVNVRSPFVISINETGQLFTQVKVYVWRKGETAPTLPTFTMSKNIASITQTECVFNISNNLKEYINPIIPGLTNTVDYESNDVWCFFRVEAYYGADIKSLVLRDSNDYVGVYGFGNYLNGTQIVSDVNAKILTNINIKNYYQTAGVYGYFNLLLDTDAEDFTITYDTAASSDIFTSTPEGIIMLKVPYSTDNLDPDVPCIISILGSIGGVYANIYTYPIDECKYTPVTCTFINQQGGWQYLTFFKNSIDSISVKNNQYNLLPDNWDYNPQRGQIKSINPNGSQNVKCNTGWVEENYKILIHDLMLSETILIDDKPAILKTQSATYKTVLKDKMINYEIEFQYAYNLLNNVI